MYVENLCENCLKGPYICMTDNCEVDRVVKTQMVRTLTTTNNTELVIAEPAKTTYFEHFLHLS